MGIEERTEGLAGSMKSGFDGVRGHAEKFRGFVSVSFFDVPEQQYDTVAFRQGVDRAANQFLGFRLFPRRQAAVSSKRSQRTNVAQIRAVFTDVPANEGKAVTSGIKAA